jgi:hypothetical protein
MADEAWNDVDSTTIQNCWCKAGILPDMSSRTTQPSIPISSLVNNTSSQTDPIIEAERQVEIALDDLVATGALQTKNQMDINTLLNLEGESQVLTETSDEEIYQAVMESIEARENIKITSGDDVDDDIVIKPRPTRREVLKAVSTIGVCIKDSNDPNAHKLEALLGSLNRQLHFDETRSMRDTRRTLHSPTYSGWTPSGVRWSPDGLQVSLHQFYINGHPLKCQSPMSLESTWSLAEVRLPPGGPIWTEWTPPQNT